MFTTINYLRGAASIGPGTPVNNLRRTKSAAAGNGLSTPVTYLRRTTSAAA
jgi:hypothetical protein